MAKFKYVGPSGVLVGRFGKLQKGTVVDLWQSEADYIDTHPTTRSFEKVKEKDDLRGVGSIVPAITKWFDLTRIFWLKETVPSLKRMSRPDLLNVCRALIDIGCPIPKEAVFSAYSREALVELVYGETKRLRWDQPGYGPDTSKVKHTVSSDGPETKTNEEEHASSDNTEDDKPKRAVKRVAKKIAKEEQPKGYRAIRREQ